jgi:glycosyltransferase involved in cell wall biosynthesis
MKTYLKSKGAWRILPITKALRDWLAGSYSIQLEEPFCMIAPMGVDLGQYEGLPESEHARKTLGLMEAFTVGYAGHMYEGRGLELMVDLATRCPESQFIWIGGEPGAVDSWQKSLRKRGVENIQVLGFVPNEQLPLYQAACEILLMPYERHIAGSSGGDTAQFASPMKTFEYMASGRVILASDLPVLREVLDDQVAMLLPPEDVEAWVRALKELIDDPERMQRLSIAAKARASQYGWKARASRTLEGLEDD